MLALSYSIDLAGACRYIRLTIHARIQSRNNVQCLSHHVILHLRLSICSTYETANSQSTPPESLDHDPISHEGMATERTTYFFSFMRTEKCLIGKRPPPSCVRDKNKPPSEYVSNNAAMNYMWLMSKTTVLGVSASYRKFALRWSGRNNSLLLRAEALAALHE